MLYAESRRVTDPQVWNREHNKIAWGMYLGDAYGTDAVPPIAAPSRITRFEGLPLAFMAVGELDLFLDEDVTYALRLIAADVSTELRGYTGAHHGFASQAPSSAVARRLVRDMDDALQRAWPSKAVA
jgi:acetyl esterase/lipase